MTRFTYEATADLEDVLRTYTEDPVHQVVGFLVDESILIGQVVDGRPFNLPGQSGHARVRLLHVFQLRDGLIANERVWFDFDEMRRQLR